jgi:hypothetical protein
VWDYETSEESIMRDRRLVISSSRPEEIKLDPSHFGMTEGKGLAAGTSRVTTAHERLNEGRTDVRMGDAFGIEASEWVGSVDQPHGRGRGLELLGRFCDLKRAEKV